MINKRIRTYTIDKFSWFPEDKQFSQELSTLCGGSNVNLNDAIFNPIYDDACDAGFAIMNPATGNVVRFSHYGTDMSDSGEDTAGWRFIPIPEDVRKHPELKNVTVLIIND